MNNAGNFQVGEFTIERFIVNITEEAHHVVLWVESLGAHVLIDIVLETVKALQHCFGLLRSEFVL